MSINNLEEYRVALIQLDGLMDAKPGSEEEDKLDCLATDIDEYEKIQFPIKIPLYIEIYVLIKTAINKVRFSVSEYITKIGSDK